MVRTSNVLLSLLTPEVRARIIAAAERVSLNNGDVLQDVAENVEYAYFLESGLCSVLAFESPGDGVEIGCIGREGFVGVPAILEVPRSPHQYVMVSDGAGWRISRELLVRHMRAEPTLSSLLLKFSHIFAVQIAATAVANAKYTIEQRMARWILMAKDRLNGGEFPFTHGHLATKLGVRRSSITTALHALEGRAAVWSSRRMIAIRDESKLREIAGSSYGYPEGEYEGVIGKSFV